MERMLQRCLTDGQFQQAVGISLEVCKSRPTFESFAICHPFFFKQARRLDKLEQAILASDDVAATLAYSLRVAQTLVASRHFRHEVRAKNPAEAPQAALRAQAAPRASGHSPAARRLVRCCASW